MNKLKTLTCPSAGMYLYGYVSLCGMVFPISGLDIPVFILWFCLCVQVCFFFNIKFSESLHIMLLNMSFLVSGFVFVLFTVFCVLKLYVVVSGPLSLIVKIFGGTVAISHQQRALELCALIPDLKMKLSWPGAFQGLRRSRIREEVETSPDQHNWKVVQFLWLFYYFPHTHSLRSRLQSVSAGQEAGFI